MRVVLTCEKKRKNFYDYMKIVKSCVSGFSHDEPGWAGVIV